MINFIVHFKKRPKENNVELEAYYLWEKAGRPEGKSDYFYKMASIKSQQSRTNVVATSNENDPYVCSNCGRQAYFDGRCGDGPILLCGCSAMIRQSQYYY